MYFIILKINLNLLINILFNVIKNLIIKSKCIVQIFKK